MYNKIRAHFPDFIVIFAFISLLIRTIYGADFTDEGYYLAMPLHFLRGGHPFVDEVLPHQTFALVLTPLLAAYTWLIPDLTGVFLFSRILYALLFLMASLTVYRATSLESSRYLSALLAVLILFFVPFSLPTLSYNTLCVGFLLIAAYGPFLDSVYIALLAGISLALGVYVYPTAAFGGLCLYALGNANYGNKERASKLRWAFNIAFIVSTLVGCIVLWRIGFDNLRSILDLNRKVGIYSISPVQFFLDFFWRYFYVLLAMIGAMVCFLVRAIPTTLCQILLSLAAVVFVAQNYHSSSLALACDFGILLSFVVFFLITNSKKRSNLNHFLAGAIVVLAFSIGLSSANGFGNAGLGFLLLLPVSHLMFSRDLTWKASIHVLAVLFFIQMFSATYRDLPPSQLSLAGRIGSGPYKGILTSKENKLFLENVEKSLAPLRGVADSLTVLHNFPAGYLFSSLHPYTRSVWLLAKSTYPLESEYYLEQYALKLPTYVMVMKSIPSLPQMQDDPTLKDEKIKQFFYSKPHDVIVTGVYFDLLKMHID